MSQKNVEIVRRGLEAGRGGDLDGAVADFAPDCEYTPSSVHPGAAEVYRGPDGYKRFVGWLLNEFDDPGVEIHELIDAGDQVVVALTNRGRGKRSGVEVSWDVWQVWTLRAGHVARGQAFTTSEEALEAAGLSE